MASAAEQAGAVGIRSNSPEEILSIKKAVSIPVIGIWRLYDMDTEIYITPTFDAAKAVKNVGADVIAFDATDRKRLTGISLQDFVDQLKTLETPLMADISSLEEGVQAAEMGVDMVATTLAGYTSYTKRNSEEPSMDLLRDLVRSVSIPVIAEGRISTPDQAVEAMNVGAYAVVVGRAITHPEYIIEKFVKELSLDSEGE